MDVRDAMDITDNGSDPFGLRNELGRCVHKCDLLAIL